MYNLETFVKKEPMLTFIGWSKNQDKVTTIDPINATPNAFTLKRKVVIEQAISKLIGFKKLVAPPTRGAALAGGPPAALTQTFNEVVKACGIYASFNASSTIPIGICTAKLSFKDEDGNVINQEYSWRVDDINAGIVALFATFEGTVVHPLMPKIGVGSEFTIDWTGPAGMNVTTELLTPKHPGVVGLLNGDLVERLIRYELSKAPAK